MKNEISKITFSIFICAILLTNCFAKEESLRTTLENTWTQYIKASQSGEESELAKSMSSFRLATMKNNLASANRSLTREIIKSIAQHAPNVNSAEFVELIEKGPTAGLVYKTNTEEKGADGEERVNFIFIKFVREGSVWKIDGGMEIGSPKFKEDGAKSVFDPNSLPPTFEIDGIILSTPDLIKIPDVAGTIDIFSSGYDIMVRINGTDEAEAKNSSFSGLIKGGLKKGNNRIFISVVELGQDPSFKPTVTIKRILEDNSSEVVFKFEPQKDIVGKHEFNFSIK